MKSISSLVRLSGIIEPLEARIAPAQVFIGDPNALNNLDTEYIETNPVPQQTLFFTNTSAVSALPGEFEGDPRAAANDLISQAVDGVFPNQDPNVPVDDYQKYVGTYYMRLKAGDSVFHFTVADNYQELVSVQAGQVIAFFVDYDHDREYDDGEFTGLALSRDVKVLVSDRVYGDIVTNLDTHGTNSIGDDTLDMSGLVSAKQGIASLQVRGGSVFGSVFSGGNIKKIVIAGNVGRDYDRVLAPGVDPDTVAGGVYAGTATNGKTFDFFPDALDDTDPDTYITGGQGAITFVQPAGKIGAAIKNGTIGSVGASYKEVVFINNQLVDKLVRVNDIQAGDGGFGAAGGSLKMIQVTNDNDGLQLLAGNGGVADAASKNKIGGAGGGVKDIYVSGVFDPTPNSPLISQSIIIKAGFGGDGLINSTGGVGGAAKNVYVGFDLDLGTAGPINSANLSGDNVVIQAGDGGDGEVGGRGGVITASNVRVQTPDGDGDEIVLRAGAGGDSLAPAGGIAGVGGSITAVDVRNQIVSFDSDILIAAGNGGTTVGEGKGAVGGSISNASLLGFDMQVLAGDGSDGKKGGAGGIISALRLLEDDRILTHNALINAGKGGNGNTGPGGAGGLIDGIRIDNSDFQNFTVNSGSQGDGGASVESSGGVGGKVTGLDIFDTDTGFQFQGPITLRAGNGGDGAIGGGLGGNMKEVVLTARNSNLIATAGHGGSAVVKGHGAAGGKVVSVQFTLDGLAAGAEVNGSISGGLGGDGIGKGGKGGKGGNAAFVNINVAGNASLVAGDGGDGADNFVTGTKTVLGGAPGKGGNIKISGLFARVGSGELLAGDAGVDGNAPAAGGSIFGGDAGELVGLRATTTLLAKGGNGSHGGAGGSINDLAYGSTAASLTPTPAGNIIIQAGDGSAEGKVAGKGGSLTLIDGAVSSGLNSRTMLLAGNGGSIPGVAIPVSEITPGSAGVSEIQRLDTAALVGIATAKFTVTIGGITSAPIDPKGKLTDFQAQLDDAFGAGAVFASRPADSKTQFDLTFDATGDQPAIVATGYTASVAGKGGAISQVSISGYFTPFSLPPDPLPHPEFILRAGDGGDATGNGKLGGNGGKVKAVGMVDIEPSTILRSIAAGDGGDARKTGGNGGGVSFVSVQDHDIGVRSGLKFGYDAMGGLFVGSGGKPSLSSGKAGLAGSVIDVNADAIASIVAGRTLVPELAEKVSRVFLNDNQQLVVRDGALVSGSPFTLTFGGNTTDIIPGNATRLQVANALNELASIKNTAPGGTGSVTVTDGANPNVSPYSTYIVTFTTNGDQVLLTGEEQVPADITTTVPGEVTAFTTTETLPGTTSPVVLETISGQRTLTVLETVSGDTLFISSEQTRGDDLATPPVSEVQRISLINLAPYPTGAFTLTFGANTTTNILGTATAQTISTRLNNLPSIIAAGGVAVSPAGNASFDIQFLTPTEQPPITGHLLVPETQRVLLGNLPTFTTGTLTLKFGASTTLPIPANPTAAQVDAALEALPSIQALPGTAGNKVAVTNPQAGEFNITFSPIGQQPALEATGMLPETQQVNLDTLPLFPTAVLKLSYKNLVSGPIPMAANRSGPVATDIDAALEALSTIQALAGTAGDKVSVSKLSTNLFNVTFNSNGDKLPLVAIGEKPEQQTLDLGNIATTFGAEFTLDVTHFVNVAEKVHGNTVDLLTRTIQEGQIDLVVTETTPGTNTIAEVQQLNLGAVGPAANGTFIIDFIGEVTAPINANSPTLAADIEAALSILQSVIDAGGVIVTGAGAGIFNITFTSAGDQARFIATGFLSEAQGVDLTTVLGQAGGEFTISFPDPIDPTIIYTTAPIAQNATPAAVGNALNNLPVTVIGNLGVTVTVGTLGDEYRIVFNQSGDRALAVGAGGGTVDREIETLNLSPLLAYGANESFTLAFNGLSTGALVLTGNDANDATAIQTALNALPSIRAIRPDPVNNPPVPPGAVAVVSTAAGVFDVTFNFFGDQPSITGLSRVGPDAQHIGTTIRLPFNADAGQIQTAVQAVSQAPVTVFPGTTAGTFTFNFGENGDQPAILGTGYLHETQNVDVYATGDFLLKFNSILTNRLAPPPEPVVDPTGAAAAEAAIDGQLEQLSSIQALTGPVGDKVEVHVGPNSSFSVIFHADGDVTPLGGTQFEAMNVGNTINGLDRNGTVGTRELQEIAYSRKGEYEVIYYSTANLVGGISDINEIDSNIFHFLHNGVLMSGSTFAPGDTPIDGLIMAKTFKQKSVNFTPEAKLTLFGFFDNDNVI